MYSIGNCTTVKVHQSLFCRWWNDAEIQTTLVCRLHLTIPSYLIIFFGCSFFFPSSSSFSLGVPLFSCSAVCVSPLTVKLCQNMSSTNLQCTVHYSWSHLLLLICKMEFFLPKIKTIKLNNFIMLGVHIQFLFQLTFVSFWIHFTRYYNYNFLLFFFSKL